MEKSMSLQASEVLTSADYKSIIRDVFPENEIVKIEKTKSGDVSMSIKSVDIKNGNIIMNNNPVVTSPRQSKKQARQNVVNNAAVNKSQMPNKLQNQPSTSPPVPVKNDDPDCVPITLQDFISPGSFGELKKTSANCFHIIPRNTDIFCKLQAYDQGDSLVGETFHITMINLVKEFYKQGNTTLADIYPIIPETIPQPYGKVTHNRFAFQGLKTIAYQNPKSLGEKLREAHSPNLTPEEKSNALIQVKTDISNLILQNMKYAATFEELSHNDLHVGNMLYDNGVLKFIDLGRMNIKLSKPFLEYFDNICKKFCIPVDDTYSRFSHVINPFHIKGPLNYMCDIMTICLNTLPLLIHQYPEWCKFERNGPDVRISVDYDLMCKADIQLADVWSMGLAWFTCCVVAYQHASDRNETRRRFENLSLRDLRDNKMMYSNNVLIAQYYEQYKDVVYVLFNSALINKKPPPHMSASAQSASAAQPASGGKTLKPKKTLLKQVMNTKKQKGAGIDQPLFNSENDVNTYLDETDIPTGELIAKHLSSIIESPIELLKLRVPDEEIKKYENVLINKARKLYHLESIDDIIRKLLTNKPVKENYYTSFHVYPLVSPVGAGGSQKHRHRVYTETSTKDKKERKYIRKNNTKWFLDEHRGSYSWASEDKKYITLKTKADAKAHKK